MTKYIRHQPSFSRQSDTQDSEDRWLNNFQQNLEKGAVTSRQQDSSIFEQINSIMNRKSRYSSVSEAVDDMKARSGLTAYLDGIKRAEQKGKAGDNKKVASSSPDNNQVIDKKIPVVIVKHPPIKQTIENCIRDTKGNLSVPAIIEKIKSIHKGDVSDHKDWEDDKLIYLVSNMNLEAKKNNPSNYQHYNNLGGNDHNATDQIDPSNNDAFLALTPAKI